MQLAAVDGARVAEAVVGAMLLAVVVVALVVALVRWRRRRVDEQAEPGVPGLARFVDAETRDPAAFGGGAVAARVQRRQDTVTYGYLAVVEEFVGAGGRGRWCTLTVSLPGRVPLLVLDHVTALGRPDVPLLVPAPVRTEDAAFDAAYVVGAADAGTALRVLGPRVRRLLLEEPVQRLLLRGQKLLLRTFDGVVLDDPNGSVAERLSGLAAGFLAGTPTFVEPSLVIPGPAGREDPLPEGRYGSSPN